MITVQGVDGEENTFGPLGAAFFNITLPKATDIDVSTNCAGNNFAHSDDAAHEVFRLRDSCQLRVQLTYEGKLQNFSLFFFSSLKVAPSGYFTKLTPFFFGI